MKMCRFIVLLLLSSISSMMVYSQAPPAPAELAVKLQGKTKFADIMNEVDKYYRTQNYHSDKKLFSEYKKWNRWAWWASRHLNQNGEIDYNPARYLEQVTTREQQRSNLIESNTGSWTSVGPTSTSWGVNRGSRGIGRIDRLVLHPNNNNIILAGSPFGGIWRTDNAGLNWYSISDKLPNCGIAGVTFDSNDPTGNTILILTGQKVAGNFLGNYNINANSAGILKTTNNGATWQKLGNSQTVLTGLTPNKLIQLRNFPNVFFAAMSNGIYSSTDFGSTWARVPGTTNAFDIEQHPTNDAVLYYSSGAYVFRSTDYGASFNQPSTYTPSLAVVSTSSQIAVTPDEPNEVYYMQSDGNVNGNRIYKSINSGADYTMINSQNLAVSSPGYNYALAVNPTNNNLMAAAGFSLTSSSDNGFNFGNVTVGAINPPTVPANYLHADIHDLVYTANGALLYCANDGGVAVSSDNGVTWTDRSNGLQCTQYYKMEGFEGAENLYIGGMQDNGSSYTTTGNHMVYAGSGDGYVCDFVNTNNDLFFMVENTLVSRYRRSTNTISTVSSGIPTANQSFYPDVICHPTNGNIAYIAYTNTVWRTTDQGSNWTQIATFSNNNGSTTVANRAYNGGFAVSPQQPDRIYAASNNTVRRSDDQGSNWSVVSGTTGWPTNIGVITDIATNSNNADELWITATGNNGANRVMYTSNAGASWVDFTGTLPNVPVYSIFYTSDGDAYVGTELGVYFMDFAMNDWLPFYNGLPMIPVTDIFVNETNGVVSAATMGRGIWRSDLYSNCAPFMNLSASVQGRNSFQTNGELQSSQPMTGSYGNELRLKSSERVRLTNGFRALEGSYLHAIIGPCGQGVFDKNAATPSKTKAEELNLPLNR